MKLQFIVHNITEVSFRKKYDPYGVLNEGFSSMRELKIPFSLENNHEEKELLKKAL